MLAVEFGIQVFCQASTVGDRAGVHQVTGSQCEHSLDRWEASSSSSLQEEQYTGCLVFALESLESYSSGAVLEALT